MMNITLWIIAGLLAIAYLTVGMMKIVRPYESIVPTATWHGPKTSPRRG